MVGKRWMDQSIVCHRTSFQSEWSESYFSIDLTTLQSCAYDKIARAWVAGHLQVLKYLLLLFVFWEKPKHRTSNWNRIEKKENEQKLETRIESFIHLNDCSI